MTPMPTPESLKDEIILLLETVKDEFFQKSLENYKCFLAEGLIGRKNSQASRLYYSVYLACLGNLFLNRPKENNYIKHEFMQKTIDTKYSKDLNFKWVINTYPSVLHLRTKADYWRKTPSEPEIITASVNAKKIIKALVERTIKEVKNVP